MWDNLVFNKIKQRLGGRIRMMATGAAPMPAHIMDFMKVRALDQVWIDCRSSVLLRVWYGLDARDHWV
jgi:hypothetical protein